MAISDITVNQLKRATAIKQQLDRLNRQLAAILGGSSDSAAAPKKTRMSVSARRKIAAAQKARWANFRRTKSTSGPARPAAKAKKKVFSPATRAKLSARLKAYWAAKKAGKK